MKKIRKPFVCFEHLRPWPIGRIILEDFENCTVFFNRLPSYSETWWSPERLLRFETLQEAINEYQKRTGNQVPDSAYNLELDWVEVAMGKDFSDVNR